MQDNSSIGGEQCCTWILHAAQPEQQQLQVDAMLVYCIAQPYGSTLTLSPRDTIATQRYEKSIRLFAWLTCHGVTVLGMQVTPIGQVRVAIVARKAGSVVTCTDGNPCPLSSIGDVTGVLKQ